MNYTTYASPEVMEAAVPLRLKLRQILLYHSAQEVHTTLREMLQEDYFFLQTLFQTPVTPTPVPPTTAGPTVVQAVPLTQLVDPLPTRIPSSSKIRVVKRESHSEPPPITKLPDPIEEEEEEPVKGEATLADRKAAIKRDNAEKTQKKFKELVSKGINPKTLLTKENLETWIKEGLTYTQMARDHVGLDAEDIGAAAKEFGLQSVIAKKRAAIIANKR